MTAKMRARTKTHLTTARKSRTPIQSAYYCRENHTYTGSRPAKGETKGEKDVSPSFVKSH